MIKKKINLLDEKKRGARFINILCVLKTFFKLISLEIIFRMSWFLDHAFIYLYRIKCQIFIKKNLISRNFSILGKKSQSSWERKQIYSVKSQDGDPVKLSVRWFIQVVGLKEKQIRKSVAVILNIPKEIIFKSVINYSLIFFLFCYLQ